jgi:hypothetical protein
MVTTAADLQLVAADTGFSIAFIQEFMDPLVIQAQVAAIKGGVGGGLADTDAAEQAFSAFKEIEARDVGFLGFVRQDLDRALAALPSGITIAAGIAAVIGLTLLIRKEI